MRTVALILAGVAVLIAIAAVVMSRRNAGPVVDPEVHELEVNVHDWNCDTGAWPHAGVCSLGEDVDDMGRYLALVRCLQAGVGRLGPEFVVSLPAREYADDYCTGAGE